MALMLTRKAGESIEIRGPSTVTVARIKLGSVRIMIDADKQAKVLRSELMTVDQLAEYRVDRSPSERENQQFEARVRHFEDVTRDLWWTEWLRLVGTHLGSMSYTIQSRRFATRNCNGDFVMELSATCKGCEVTLTRSTNEDFWHGSYLIAGRPKETEHSRVFDAIARNGLRWLAHTAKQSMVESIVE